MRYGYRLPVFGGWLKTLKMEKLVQVQGSRKDEL